MVNKCDEAKSWGGNIQGNMTRQFVQVVAFIAHNDDWNVLHDEMNMVT